MPGLDALGQLGRNVLAFALDSFDATAGRRQRLLHRGAWRIRAAADEGDTRCQLGMFDIRAGGQAKGLQVRRGQEPVNLSLDGAKRT